MLAYKPQLKPLARRLRAEMTDTEHRLWFRLRRKQLLGVQFYRQKPIGKYIVDRGYLLRPSRSPLPRHGSPVVLHARQTKPLGHLNRSR